LLSLNDQCFLINCHHWLLKRHCLLLIAADCILLWNSDNVINYFFNDFGYFYYFGYCSVNLKYIININQIHNFCSYHSDHTLINLENNSFFSFYLFHFLK